MSKPYFFDTYALIALIQGKESYSLFLDRIIITTIFNLTEFYYLILRDYNEAKARELYASFKNYAVNVSDEVIFKAMEFRLKNKKANPKSNLSYVDCIGYECAKSSRVRFVTGDREFKGLENVEFVV